MTARAKRKRKGASRLPGAREPNGRLSRRSDDIATRDQAIQESAMETAVETRRRLFGLTKEEAKQRQWYVARLTPGATRPARIRVIDPEERKDESIVERSLRDGGFDCYIPRMKLERKHHRTKKMIVRSHPLFTGYAFVAVAAAKPRLDLLKECDGVGGILGLDGRPWPVPAVLIDQYRAAEAQMTFDDTREARIKRKQEGRTVRDTTAMRFPDETHITVTDGPFAGFNGHVQTVTGRGLVRVAVQLFGRLTPVELEPGQVKKVA